MTNQQRRYQRLKAAGLCVQCPWSMKQNNAEVGLLCNTCHRRQLNRDREYRKAKARKSAAK
jgi:hypothetical protein